MKQFADMFRAVDCTTSTKTRIAALVTYLESASDQDKLWCVALFSGRRPKRAVNATEIRTWAAEAAGIPLWLFEDTYHVVGDLAETVAHLLPPPTQPLSTDTLTSAVEGLQAITGQEVEVRKAWVLAQWDRLDAAGRFVFNKLLTGGFRIGISQKNMGKALAQLTGQDEAAVAHRLMGVWTPENTTFEALLLGESAADAASKPYPFYLAYALEDPLEHLGPVTDWQAEYKWDGIRGQLISRAGEVFVWSRGEELVTERYPELLAVGEALPEGVVLDGEIICHDGERPLSFGLLQKRIGRKSVGKKLLAEAPVKMIAYDLLEWEGRDLRSAPFADRRALLEALVRDTAHRGLLLSERLPAQSWDDLVQHRKRSREARAEGLMLKRLDAPYHVGRKKGDMWKWKVAPLSIDAVLIYAMRGHGRRANLYTDYTFAVWKGGELVPFAKAYSGLTDAEFKQVDRFVKQNTLERFGPVRSVTPALVFELHFEGIARSTRHKSGVALRFPRMHRWRQDKPAKEANTYEDLMAVLAAYGG